MNRARAVVCLSGGMDSTVCAALAARDFEAYGLHLSYGQRTEERELRAAREVARAVGLVQLLELRSDLFRRIGGSALTDRTIQVPEAAGVIPEAAGAWAPDERLRSGDDIPVTYVPFRNAHFLSPDIQTAGQRIMRRSTIWSARAPNRAESPCAPR
jgi:7-cyano-7-deazaguanine synthase